MAFFCPNSTYFRSDSIVFLDQILFFLDQILLIFKKNSNIILDEKEIFFRFHDSMLKKVTDQIPHFLAESVL